MSLNPNPPPPIVTVPPPAPVAGQRPGGFRPLLAGLLNVFAVLFLIDGIFSLADQTFIWGWGMHVLSVPQGIVSFLVLLLTIAVYCLMGLTPLIPKRRFLPLVLFAPVSLFLIILCAIYYYERVPVMGWVLAAAQVLLGMAILRRTDDGVKVRGLPVKAEQLPGENFSWRNLALFAGINIFVLLPLLIVCLFLSAALAVDHYSDGFMALHPGGFTVQVRKYVRFDGKTIELFPMSHVADSGFYKKVAATFPTNSVILMEGVTDEHNLLTNRISYKRMARSLGLSEQKEEFVPSRGKMVRADVDVDIFSDETIHLLNLVMLFHANGTSPELVRQLTQYSPPPHFEDQLFGDLLGKRNKHLLEEIRTNLPQADNIMVPWGVAHMPGIAKQIQKEGFKLEGAQDYMVIRFGGGGK